MVTPLTKEEVAWTHENILIFQVLTATSMKMFVFWDVAPSSPVDTD